MVIERRRGRVLGQWLRTGVGLLTFVWATSHPLSTGFDRGRVPVGHLASLASLKSIGLSLLVGLAVLGGEGRGESPTDPQPFNVLFIAVDDLRTELGCYGVGDAQSPNLDRLASQAVRFTQHYVQVPTCGASRYALLTGRSPARSGVTASNVALYRGPSALKATPNAGAASMPELFRRNGYRTICIGKISHTPDGRVFEYNGRGDGYEELPEAWDELATPFGSWERGWGTFFAYANGRHREDGKGHKDLMEFIVDDDRELPDGLMAEAALVKLAELKAGKQPFFMGLGFFKPHLPFVAPRQDWEAFDESKISAPSAPDKTDSEYWHNSGEFYKYDMPFAKSRPLAPQDAVTARRAYLACVRYVDRQIGKVLEGLDEMGLSDSTIVVVWGDHGWHLGESALWGKHSPFERAVQSTLLIRAPGMSASGQSCDALVETLDLYPTLVDLCQLENTETQFPLVGQSLRSLLSSPDAAWREHSISYWKQAISIRNSDYRLIFRNEQPASAIELYDLTTGADPRENLAEQHPEIVRELLKQATQLD